MKKITAFVLAMIIIVSAFSLSASATTYSVSDTGGGSLSIGVLADYSEAWEINSYYDSQRGILKFGFSTAGIGNKDYCSAFHTSKAHKASVSNSEKTTVTSDSASAGSYTSTVKVTHAARPVWSAIY